MSQAEEPTKELPPVPLHRKHDISEFDCGRDEVNHWLHHYARQAKAVGSAVTYVACYPDSRLVIGYYALAMGSAEPEESPPRLYQGLGGNFEIPIARLVWLGTDESESGKGVGRRLLLDAFQRVLEVAQHIGCRAVIVDALEPGTEPD